MIYVWSEQDKLKQFKLTNGLLQTTPVATSTMFVPTGMPGAMLSLSANGSLAGSGIVWASHPYNADSNLATVPGIFRAFDASNVSVELWNSKQNAARDDVGNFGKFCPATVANGKVYLATFSNRLVVYGLLGGTSGGSLVGSLATPVSPINLTSEGTTDWAHWGLNTATSFDHKAGVSQRISNYTLLGTTSVARFADNPTAFTWSDGTPTASATNTNTGVFVPGLNKGFQITLPADTTSRTLRIYLGLWKAQTTVAPLALLRQMISALPSPLKSSPELSTNVAAWRVTLPEGS
jgi:hypothetical protein